MQAAQIFTGSAGALGGNFNVRQGPRQVNGYAVGEIVECAASGAAAKGKICLGV